MNPPPRTLSEEEQKLIDEFLKTNKVTKFEKYKKSDVVEYNTSFYGKKKKPKKE
jgi:hypothetical protein